MIRRSLLLGYGAGMSFRLAAYAMCVEDGRVLLAYHAPTKNWTLPGGGFKHGEDPFDAVTREVAESVWTPIPDVAHRRRSSLVDVGLTLAQTLPATGHVAHVPIGGLIQH